MSVLVIIVACQSSLSRNCQESGAVYLAVKAECSENSANSKRHDSVKNMANSSKTIKFLPLVTQNETPIEVKGQQLPPENNIQKSQVCSIQHWLLVVAGGFFRRKTQILNFSTQDTK